MDVTYRAVRKQDSYRIAELDYISSGGASKYLFHDLVPDSTPVQVVAYGLEKDIYPHPYRIAIVAELNNTVIGMSQSYPAEFHRVTDHMRKFFPPERLEHFKAFFSPRVDNSCLIDAICVDREYKNKGIGAQLLQKSIAKARNERFSLLNRLIFADNHKATEFYKAHGFTTKKK